MNHSNSSTAVPQTAGATPAVAPLATSERASAYEAPAIESLFSPDDLQREVLYAAPGGPSIIDPDPPPFP